MKRLMANEMENAYFRKLRMIYCSELQMISLLPDLSAQITDFKLGSSIDGLLRLCRERRNALEMIAMDHAISVAGDDCETMRKLVGEARQELRHCSRGLSRDEVVADVCVSVHRLLVIHYSLARNLAARLGLEGDADRLEELIDLIVERFPQTCEYPGPRTAFARPAMAIH
jgi:ferritin-like metal-binding protein YciE